MAIPTPPAGFTIDETQEALMPAPPAGFTIDGQAPVAPKKKPGMLEYGAKRMGQGALGIAGAFANLGEGVYRASGFNAAADNMKSLRESQIEKREQSINGDIGEAQSFIQGDDSLKAKYNRGELGAGDIGKAVGDLVLTQIPQFVVGGAAGKAVGMLGGAMKTKGLVNAGKALVTKEAAKEVAKGRLAGNLVGNMAAMSAQETGSIYGEQKDGEKDLLKAAATGVPAGMLEGLSQFHTMGRSGLGGLLESSMKRPGRLTLKSGTKEGLKTLAEEGGTEGAQNVLEQAGAKPGYDILSDLKSTNLTEVGENVIGGMVMGGSMHGAGSAHKAVAQKFGDRADARFIEGIEQKNPATIAGSSVKASAIVASAMEAVAEIDQAAAQAEQQKVAEQKAATDPQAIAEVQAKAKALDVTPAEHLQIQQIYDDPNTASKNKEKAGALLVKLGDIANTQASKEQKQAHDQAKMENKETDFQAKEEERIIKVDDLAKKKEIEAKIKLAELEKQDQHTTIEVKKEELADAAAQKKIDALKAERASISGEGSAEAKAKITEKIKSEELISEQERLKTAKAKALSDMATDQRAEHEYAEAFKTPESAIAAMRAHVDEVFAKGKQAWTTFKEFAGAMTAKFGSLAKQYLLKVWKYAKSINTLVGTRGSISNKPIIKKESEPDHMAEEMDRLAEENRQTQISEAEYGQESYDQRNTPKPKKTRRLSMKEALRSDEVHQNMLDALEVQNENRKVEDRASIYHQPIYKATTNEHLDALREEYANESDSARKEEIRQEGIAYKKALIDSVINDTTEAAADYRRMLNDKKYAFPVSKEHAGALANLDYIQGNGEVEHMAVMNENERAGEKQEDMDTKDLREDNPESLADTARPEDSDHPDTRKTNRQQTDDDNLKHEADSGKQVGFNTATEREAVEYKASNTMTVDAAISKLYEEAGAATEQQQYEVFQKYRESQIRKIDSLLKRIAVSKHLAPYKDIIDQAMYTISRRFDVTAAIHFIENESNRTNGTWDIKLDKMKELPAEVFQLEDLAQNFDAKKALSEKEAAFETARDIIETLSESPNSMVAAQRLIELAGDKPREGLRANPIINSMATMPVERLAGQIQKIWDAEPEQSKYDETDPGYKVGLQLTAERDASRLSAKQKADKEYEIFKNNPPLDENKIIELGTKFLRQIDKWRNSGLRIGANEQDLLKLANIFGVTKQQALQIMDMLRVKNTAAETGKILDDMRYEFVRHYDGTEQFMPMPQEVGPFKGHMAEIDKTSEEINPSKTAREMKDVNQLGMVWDEEAVDDKFEQESPVSLINAIDNRSKGYDTVDGNGRHYTYKVTMLSKRGKTYSKMMMGEQINKINGPEYVGNEKIISVSHKSARRLDILADDYLGRDYIPTLIRMEKLREMDQFGGPVPDGKYRNLRKLWAERENVKKQIIKAEEIKGTEVEVKKLRAKQVDIEKEIAPIITRIKIALFKEKLKTLVVVTPARLESMASDLKAEGYVGFTAPDLYQILKASDYDFATFKSHINRAMLEQSQAAVDFYNVQEVIKPVKSEEEKSAALSRGITKNNSLEKFYERIVKESPWEATSRRIDEFVKQDKPEKQNKAIEGVFSGKPIHAMSAFEKGLSEQFSTPENQVKPGRFKNKIVHGFFEKIAKMFGAKLIVVRDFSGEFKGGYFPQTEHGPVIAVNADSGFSFTRVFAHELFHHALNKISSTAYTEFKAAVEMSVDKKKWDTAVQTIARKYNIQKTLQPQTINSKGRYGSPFAQNNVIHGRFTPETGSKFAPEKTQNKEIQSVKSQDIDYDKKVHAEEELYSELFSHAFMQNEFWEHMSKTTEGKGLAVKLAVKFMQRTVEVTNFLSGDKKARSIKEIQDLVTDWDGMAWDWSDQSSVLAGERDLDNKLDDYGKRQGTGSFKAARSSVHPSGQPIGGIYQALSMVMDQALLSKTLQHGDTKNFTTAKAKEAVLNHTWRQIVKPGDKSHKDIMTNIENLLNKVIDWIADHKPAGVFEDFRKNRDIVNMMQRLNHAGNLQRQLAMQQVVEKHKEAFKDMTEAELADMHDMMVRKQSQSYWNSMRADRKEAFKAMSKFLAPIHQQMKDLGIVPENFEFNTNGQVIRWMTKKDVAMGQSLDSILRDDISNLKRDEKFLKNKKQNWHARTKTTMQIAEENDLKFRDINPLTMFAKYVEDAQALITLKELLNEGQTKGYVKHFQEKGMMAADDAALKQINSFTRGGVQVGIKLEDGSMLKNPNGSEMRFPDTQSARDYIDSNPSYVGENAEAKAFGEEDQNELLTRSHFTVQQQTRSFDDKSREVWTTNDTKSFDTQKAAEEYAATLEPDGTDNRSVVEPAFAAVNNETKTQLYFHPDMAKMLNVILSEDRLRRGEVLGISGEQLMNFKNTMTMMELSMSAFHAFTIGQELVSSYAGWAAQQYGIGKGLLSLNPMKAYKESRQINELIHKIMDNPAIATDPATKAEVKRLFGTDDINLVDLYSQFFGHGGMMHQDESLKSGMQAWGSIRYTTKGDGKFVSIMDSARGVADSFHETLEELRQKHPDSKILPFSKAMVHHAMVGSTAWLMEEGIPKIKFASFAREYTLKVRKSKVDIMAGRITKEELANDTMKFIEDRFGEVNWKNMWLNKSNKTALQFMFRSFTWVAGSWKALAKAGIDMAKMGWFTVKGEKYEMTEKGYWGMMAVASHVATVAALSIPYAMAVGMGADEQETEEDTPLLTKMLFPRIDPYDNTKRVTVPSYVSEAYKILMHLGMNGNKVEISKLITGRFNSVVGGAVDLMKNEDFKGVLIRNSDNNMIENTYAMVKHVLPIPISFAGIYKSTVQEGGDASSAMFSAMGATDAPAGAKRSPAANLAFDLSRREYKGKEMTSDEMDMKDEFKRAMKKYVTGDKSDVNNLLAEGRVSERQYKNALERYPILNNEPNPKYKDQLSQAMSRLTVKSALKVYEVMSDVEKEKHSSEIDKKIKNMRIRKDTPRVEQNVYIERWSELRS